MPITFMNRQFLWLLLLFVFFSCGQKRYLLETSFSDCPIPPPPDYSSEDAWASLPSKKDPADSVPGKHKSNGEAVSLTDVFFIHPTIFTYKPTSAYQWNGDVHDRALNKATDESTILYQASVFNGSCRVFAPRYRQAHISAFYKEEATDGKKALDIAYSDVRAAFLYYLAHYNDGRPIIIASHSQGTLHAEHLLQEFFKDDSLRTRLVAAYLIGMPINPDSLRFLPPCTAPDETGCYCTWNTFARGYYPAYYNNGLAHAICTNPLSWQTDSSFCGANLNEGGILRNFEKIHPHISNAQVHEGMLWIDKPDFPGSKLLNIKIYHVVDYNLFYFNIRSNVQQRTEVFRKRQSLH